MGREFHRSILLLLVLAAVLGVAAALTTLLIDATPPEYALWIAIGLGALVGLLAFILLSRLAPQAPLSAPSKNPKSSENPDDDDHFRQMIERLSDVVYSVDLEGKITYANPAIRKLTGHTPNEILGHRLSESVIPDWRVRVEELYERQLKGNTRALQLEYPLLTRHGVVKWVEETSTLLFSDGELSGRRGVLRDITSKIRAEESRKKLRTMQKEFVANVSHELRTPLTSILGYLQMLERDQQLNEQQKDRIAIILRNAKRLNQLVDDIMDAEKLDLGQMEFHFDPVDIADLVEDVCRTFSINAEEKGLAIETSIERGLIIEADEDRIVQAFSNLVSNAIKYTEAGKISVAVAVDEDRSATVSISDTGIGISEEDQAHLFERFFRSSADPVQSVSGTGLGLYITKGIVERHSGTMQIQSELGKGTCWSVTLPLAKHPR